MKTFTAISLEESTPSVFLKAKKELYEGSVRTTSERGVLYHSPKPTDPIPVKPRVWKMVGIDLVGPLPETLNGNKYIITVVDYFSKWPEAEAIPKKSAKCVALFLYKTMCRQGSPKVILTDQGREFVNQVNKHLFSLTKTEHRVSTAYHPQTNGLVERFNQTLQRSLLKLANKEQNNWDTLLDGALFAYRTSKQGSTGVTPFEVMYCRKAVLPIECDLEMDREEDLSTMSEDNIDRYIDQMDRLRRGIYEKTDRKIKKAQERQKINCDKRLNGRTGYLKPGTVVLMRNSHHDGRKNGKFKQRYLGLYKIAEHLGKGVYKLQSIKTVQTAESEPNYTELHHSPPEFMARSSHLTLSGPTKHQDLSLPLYEPSLHDGFVTSSLIGNDVFFPEFVQSTKLSPIHPLCKAGAKQKNLQPIRPAKQEKATRKNSQPVQPAKQEKETKKNLQPIRPAKQEKATRKNSQPVQPAKQEKATKKNSQPVLPAKQEKATKNSQPVLPAKQDQAPKKYCTCRTRCNSKKFCPSKQSNTVCSKTCHPGHSCTNHASHDTSQQVITHLSNNEASSNEEVPKWKDCAGVRLNAKHKRILE